MASVSERIAVTEPMKVNIDSTKPRAGTPVRVSSEIVTSQI